MLGTKIEKPLRAQDVATYKAAAAWCNSNNAQMVEHEEFYQVELLPEPTLNDLREAKLANLGAFFNERVSGSFTTSQGYLMQFDTSDAIKMQGAIQLLETSGATEGYLTQANDETIYNVPTATMKAVLLEMMAAFAACHARKQEIRAMIKAAETVKELDAIEITWPV